ncbi:MAG TPA: hypothetical protein VEV38_07970 [Candidatus Eremiobacteraceae bacterium]|nr:hypothetical protein [Candidatus Eremiobacteraceae bacterium]
MKHRNAIAAIALAFAATFFIVDSRPLQAMPPFAQAYGEDCSTCHTAVPALNAYGRYVQRTGYSSLDPSTIHHAIPIWLGENPTYDSKGAPHIVTGNFAIHGSGFIGTDWTFHAQEWLVNGNQPGFADTMWVTYNNLLHRDGHLFIGKIEAPAPSPYSQWSELAGFSTTGMTSGEHAWEFGANRWGTKLSYTHDWIVAEAAYLGNSGDLNTATDFSNDTDRSVDWRFAYAPPQIPFEAGVYGSAGHFPISDGMTDPYHGIGYYAQMDPMGGWMPGIFTAYQLGHDPDAGAGLGASTSKAYTFDVFEPLFKQRVMLGARSDFSDDGFGNLTHSNNIDLEWMAVKDIGDRNVTGLIANLEAATSPGSGPDWVGQLWYVTTVGPLH